MMMESEPNLVKRGGCPALHAGADRRQVQATAAAIKLRQKPATVSQFRAHTHPEDRLHNLFIETDCRPLMVHTGRGLSRPSNADRLSSARGDVPNG